MYGFSPGFLRAGERQSRPATKPAVARSALALAAIATVATTTPAHAYLDPGSGSMLLQLLLGGVAGALVVGRLYWQRLKAFVMRRPAGGRPGSPSQE